MLPYIRQQKLIESLQQNDIVYIKDLAEELSISESTIRRDLLHLSKLGDVQILHGGAAQMIRKDYEEPINKKILTNMDAKERIAKKAASLVEMGDYIYVDSGTTTSLMVKYIASKKVTVVTSSLLVTSSLPVKGVYCIFLGGELLEDQQSLVGTITEKALENMYFDKAFIGANAYIENEAVYTFDVREARKKEIVIERSKKAYFLLDTTKKNKKTFARVCDISECEIIDEL